jgi:hypothetical protein
MKPIADAAAQSMPSEPRTKINLQTAQNQVFVIATENGLRQIA